MNHHDFPDEVRQAGIDSLEALLELFAEADAHNIEGVLERLGVAREKFSERLLGETPDNIARGIKHRPPVVPTTINGRQVAGDEISRFDGRVLHFILGGREDEDTLEAYTSASDALVRLQELGVRPGVVGDGPVEALAHYIARMHVLRSHVSSGSDTATFFEHERFDGAQLRLEYQHVWWDLTKVWMSGFLWWWTSWNDRITGVRTGSTPVTLWEHVGLVGSTLTVLPFRSVSNLTPFGWNDRASSLANSWSFIYTGPQI